MSIYVAAIRPPRSWEDKAYITGTVSSEFEILLLEYPDTNEKYLPRFELPSQEDDFLSASLGFIYHLTGGLNGGLKGIRVIAVPDNVDYRQSSVCLRLVVVIVNPEDKLNAAVIGQVSGRPRFYALRDKMFLPESGRDLFVVIKHWLQKVTSSRFGIHALMTPVSERRLVTAVINPAYASSRQSADHLLPNQVLTRMLETDKSDYVTINSMFLIQPDNANESTLMSKTDIRKAARQSKLETNKLLIRLAECSTGPKERLGFETESLVSGQSSERFLTGACLDGQLGAWMADYPGHYAAYAGDVGRLRALCERDAASAAALLTQSDAEGWCALHYAVVGKSPDAANYLIAVADTWRQSGARGADSAADTPIVNQLTLRGSTPLHLAVQAANAFAVETLLKHPDVDTTLVNSAALTARQLCEFLFCIDSATPHHASLVLCHELLEELHERLRSRCVAVHLMDGTVVDAPLPAGYNTTVSQIQQSLSEHVPVACNGETVLTLWICSRSLSLQLRSKHLPLEQLQRWPSTLAQLTDVAHVEKAKLFLKRNVNYAVRCETLVTNASLIHLLFREAYHNYISGLLPCNTDTCAQLVALLLQLYHGYKVSATNAELVLPTTLPSRRVKALLASGGASLLPPSRLKCKAVPPKVVQQCKKTLDHLFDDVAHLPASEPHSALPASLRDSQATLASTESEVQLARAGSSDTLSVTSATERLQRRSYYRLVCEYKVVAACRQCATYGCAFFACAVVLKHNAKPQPAQCGVNAAGLYVLQTQHKHLLAAFPMSDIRYSLDADVTDRHTGCAHSTMHVASRTGKQQATLRSKQVVLIYKLLQKFAPGAVD